MQMLNFPEFQFDFKKQDDKILIFDIIRKKHIQLTSEEWVRQHLIHYLISHKSYPRSLIKIETGLKYHRRQKRADIVVYDTKGEVLLIAECKAPNLVINEKALFQIGIYQKSMDPAYLVVTNGITHYCWKKDFSNSTFQLLPEIPDWQQIT